MASAPPFVLPARQAETLRWLADYRSRRGIGPTHREIAAGLRLSTNNVTPYLAPLIERGLITKTAGSRSLDVTWAGRQWLAANPLPQLEMPLVAAEGVNRV
ncbi:MAG: hypothetical protein PHE83_17555 [Opitutaceae bacterium]|nr:hypothetical protein [Opitutaceae bacterium]